MNLAELSQSPSAPSKTPIAGISVPLVAAAMRAPSTHPAATSVAPPRPAPARPLWRRTADWMRACIERSQQRHALMTLDDRMLSDVGLSRADAAGEYRKPFWRP